MNYNSMAVFASVVKFGSFTRAAKELAMPLSTVSRKVSELEASLQAKLLDRSTRSLRLTDIGVTFYQHCQQGVDAFNFANQSLRQHRTEEHGSLHISVPPNLAESLFLPIVAIFQSRYKQANVTISVSERLLDFVDDGLDLSFRVSPPQNPDHVALSLLKYSHVMVAAPNYISISGYLKSIDDLKEHDFLGFGFHHKPDISWTLNKGPKTHTHTFKPKVAINDYAGVLEATRLGLGIGELPAILCQSALENGQLTPVLPDWSFPKIILSAVYPGKQSLSRLARLFLDICKEQFRLKRRDLPG